MKKKILSKFFFDKIIKNYDFSIFTTFLKFFIFFYFFKNLKFINYFLNLNLPIKYRQFIFFVSMLIFQKLTINTKKMNVDLF